MFITLHSYGDLVLWPWGNITTAAPNKTGLKAIGDKFATYNGYESCQPSICLYITSGTSDDHVYGELGAPAYTFEVGSTFMPSYSVIDAVQWPENKPAFIYAAKIARTPYMTVKGPDALNVNSNVSGTNLTLTTSINDSANGGQTIAAAKYYLDTPSWAGGVAGNMDPTDGNFNSVVEGATVTVDVSGLPPGQHIALIQGQDSAGNLGAISAVFFTVSGGPTPTPPPSGNTLHVGDLDNASTPSGNNWNAVVVVTVHDQNDAPLAGAVVSGAWSNGTSGSGTCTTNASGQCSLTRTNIRGSISAVTFSVTNVTLSSFTYQPGSNHDPDGDSTGTVIVLNKP
jgi:hypothetical protein